MPESNQFLRMKSYWVRVTPKTDVLVRQPSEDTERNTEEDGHMKVQRRTQRQDSRNQKIPRHKHIEIRYPCEVTETGTQRKTAM